MAKKRATAGKSGKTRATAKSAMHSTDDRLIECLRAMRETQLHTDVVFPLLRKMGLQHVQYVHGSAEKGKDIVYLTNSTWKNPRLEVCQVKNEPFSGKSNDSNNTSAVLNQLRQCRQVAVWNPATQRNELPQGVVLFTTYDLPDKDLQGSSNLLDTLKKENVEIISPDMIVQLLKAQMPDLYGELVFPGSAIASRLQRYANTHHERAAFPTNQSHSLDAFFVNLSVKPLSDLLTQHHRRGLYFADRKTKRFHVATKSHCDVLESLYSPMRTDIGKATLLQRVQTTSFGAASRLKAGSECKRASEESDFCPPAATGSEKTEITIEDVHIRSVIDYCNRVVALAGRDVDQIPLAINLLCSTVRLCEQANSYLPGFIFTRDKKRGTDKVLLSDLQAVPPRAFLGIEGNICFVGQAGAGKTSLVRSICLEALKRDEKVIYFPCHRIKDSSNDLESHIKSFLHDLRGQQSTGEEDVVSYMTDAKLFIIDGCDEASTFGTELGSQIQRLAWPKEIRIKFDMSGTLELPEDLKGSINADDATGEIVISDAINDVDQRRILLQNPDSDTISKLHHLFTLVNSKARRVLVTTRESQSLKLGSSFRCLQLLPFTPEQRDLFLEKWLAESGSDVESLKRFLRDNGHIGEVCCTPIVATLVATLHERGINLPRSRTAVYIERYKLLMTSWAEVRLTNVGERTPVRRRRIPSDLMPFQHKMLFLSILAFDAHKAHESFFTAEAAEKVWITLFLPKYPKLAVAELLWDLQVNHSVIVAEPGDCYSFGHHSYQEFLAANMIVHRPKFIRAITFSATDARWRNVASFYVGITGDASQLIEILTAVVGGIPNGTAFLQELLCEAMFTEPSAADFVADFSEPTLDEEDSGLDWDLDEFGDEFEEEDDFLDE